MASLTTSPKLSVSQITSKPSPLLRLAPTRHRFTPPPSLPSKTFLKTSIFSSSAVSASSSPRRRPPYIPNHIPDPNYVRIFDTTLREGEQSPGATLTSKEKLDIARQLAMLGVDIIEAGFPAASKDDFEAVKQISKEVGNAVDKDGYVPVICGLSRCNENDIKTAWEAVKYAKRPRIHTFIATSPIHMEYKLRKSKEEVVEIARSMVRYARSLGCDDVEFSPEDAGRSEREFLYHILGEAIKAGATTLNIPDTVGITIPSEFGQLIADIKANTPGIENVVISTHCQNDLGLSTANTLAGAFAGARQLEVTVNGIGGGAGNASLEEVVMAIKCRGEHILGGLYTGIDTRHITMASKMVEEYTGLHVQPHKAIVGLNAFAHESGIHQEVNKGNGLLPGEESVQESQPKTSQLTKRIVFGLGIGVSTGGVVLAGGWVFTVFLAVAVFVGAREYFELVRSRGITEGMTPPPRYVSRVCSVICSLMPLLTMYFGQIDTWVTFAAFLVAIALLLQRGNPRFAQLSSTMFGLFYCGYLPCFWVNLRCGLAAPALNTRLAAGWPILLGGQAHWTVGLVATLISLSSIIATDTYAFIGGKTFGRTPLTSISPKKTWEGTFVGLGGCIASTLILSKIFCWPTSILSAIAFGFLNFFGSVFGDLTESMIKRDAGVKDSGSLIPGHGGILDRVDSYIFTGALAYSFVKVFLPLYGV